MGSHTMSVSSSLSSNPLGYVGINLYSQPDFIVANRAPTTADVLNPGTRWQHNNTSPKVIYETTGAGNWEATNTSGSFTNLTADGTVDINTSGAGVTTIGTGGTGATNIGNATGNTAVTGDLATTGDLSTDGNLILSSVATYIQMNGGAVTDFIGSATLVAGEVTVANTNIAANDRILVVHADPNASTGIGTLTYTISAGATFTVTSLDATASTETGDLSDIVYVIFRQS